MNDQISRNDQEVAGGKRPRSLLHEIWDENRFIIKLLIGHTALTLVLIAILAGTHYILERGNLPPDRKHVIDVIHFWGLISALCLLLGGFIIEVILFVIQTIRAHRRGG